MRHLLLVLIVWLASLPAVQARDWLYWRGPEQNGVSREKDLPEKWAMDGENFVFAVPYQGLCSPVVHKGHVYTVGRTGTGETQQENVQCFDAENGKLLWEKKFNVWHSEIVDARLGFTNPVVDPETGNVYVHTTAGHLFCFSSAGKNLWTRSMAEEFGRVTGYGGRVTFPFIDEDKVIVTMVNGSWGELTVGGTRVAAFDKKTGKIVYWGSGGQRVKDTYYSAPAVAVINGVRTLVTGSGDGHVHAFKARTGEKLWSYKLDDGGGAINCSPVIKGTKVWIGHGEENAGTQGRLVCLDAGEVKDGKPKEVWRHDGVKVKFASPVLHEGLLYVCDDAGKLYCFDAEKGPQGGEELWAFRYGRATKGSPVWADGKLYISEVDGKFHILKPSKDGCKRLSAVAFRGTGVAPVGLHGTPAVANGKIYFTTTEQLICIGKKGHKAKAGPLPAQPKEPPAGKVPAYIQVYPADVTIHPGEKAEFEAFAYDDKGRKIGPVEVTWERAGVLPPVFPPGIPAPKPDPKAKPAPQLAGTLSSMKGKSTTFTAAKVPNGMWGRVVVKSGKLTGHARVLVAPNLPYTQDFTKVPEGRTPAWVNAPGKFMVVKGPGGKPVLKKRNDNPAPPINNANAYIGTPDMSDYTVQSDVYAVPMKTGGLPDMGVGAHRYLLVIVGNDKEARLVTWDAQKRLEKSVPFTLKPKTWYTMKITATVKGGKGVVKGKVWERGAKEPEKWGLELVDPVPIKAGAPFIFGFPNGASDAGPGPEIYYDNVKVTKN